MTLRAWFVCGLFVVLLPAGGSGAIPDREYAARRESATQMLDSTGAMLLGSADYKTRSSDVAYRFRQDNNILYLTGVEEPGVRFLLAGRAFSLDGAPTRAALFAPKDALQRLKASPRVGGVPVVDASRLQEILGAVLPALRTLYLSAPDIRFVNDWVNDRQLFLDRDTKKELENRFPDLKIKSPGPILSALRGTKSEAEVEIIRRAIALTGDGISRAIAVCAPGKYEYELQAAIEYEMVRQGSVSPAYPSIVGSGPNSLIPHYDDNRRKMEKGDLVVMDVGAEVENYSADVTRTLPVSGRFTPEQRKLYDAVLRSQEAVIAAIRPGATFSELGKIARKVLAEHGYAEYLTHGISHHIGLDTHDSGPMDTLRAGMVITVEPGVYVPVNDTVLAAGYRGNGIRIEDDVLVTGKGNTVLSEAIPKKAGEIEALMKRNR